jgi:hypothetical protein
MKIKNKIENPLVLKVKELEESLSTESEFPISYLVTIILDVMGGVFVYADGTIKHKFVEDLIALANAYRQEE